MKQINWKIPVILIFIMISGGCSTLKSRNGAEVLELVESTAALSVETEAEGAAVTELQPETAETAKLCYVHICGAVENPGVYQVSEGERIFRVVELAGGYTEDAAQEYLNLAGQVVDGMKLAVPTASEYERMEGQLFQVLDVPEANPGSGKVNLNTATKEQLMKLSGIGEAKAEAIIKYRNEHGGFAKPEDIMKIPGIKQAAFERIKDEITIMN